MGKKPLIIIKIVFLKYFTRFFHIVYSNTKNYYSSITSESYSESLS